jgi:hypothetical protein
LSPSPQYGLSQSKFDAAEVEVNASGGAQSKLEGRYDMIPGNALHVLAKVFAFGARKYARNNWKRIPYEDHINHAMAHLASLMNDERDEGDEDHLAHAFCRLAMAVSQREDTDAGYAFSFKAIGEPIKK